MDMFLNEPVKVYNPYSDLKTIKKKVLKYILKYILTSNYIGPA